MKLRYSISIDNPNSHLVKVSITGEKTSTDQAVSFFLPCWSPGSYLMREYGRNIRWFSAQTSNGETLHHEQTAKSQYCVTHAENDLYYQWGPARNQTYGTPEPFPNEVQKISAAGLSYTDLLEQWDGTGVFVCVRARARACV